MNVWCILLIYYLANLVCSFGEKIRNSNLIFIETGNVTTPSADSQSSVKHRITYTRNELLGLRHHHDNRRLPCSLPYNAIRSVRNLRLNRKRSKKRIGEQSRYCLRKGINHDNLITLSTNSTFGEPKTRHGLSVATINVRSVKNKDHILMEELKTNNTECVVMTETWLRAEDEAWVNQSCMLADNFHLDRHDRGSRGGGLALLYKKHLKLESKNSEPNAAYENAVWKLHNGNKTIRLLGIYRPPTTSSGVSISEFIDILSDQVAELLQDTSDLIILGDFNIHIRDVTSNEVLLFNSTMSAFGFTQLIDRPTHNSGNILDLIFVNSTTKMTTRSVEYGPFISDHRLLTAEFSTKVNTIERRNIQVRNRKNFDHNNIVEKINLPKTDGSESLQSVCNQLSNELQKALDECLPEKTCTIGDRKKSTWVTSEVLDQRRIVRKRQNVWERYRQDHQWMAYKRERNRLNRMLVYNKTNEVSGKILECGKDTKKLHKYINSITSNNTLNPMPNAGSEEDLAEDFANFFLQKIVSIRDNLSTITDYASPIKDDVPQLTSFSPMTPSEIKKIIMSMPSKSCELDPLPTDIFKQILPDIMDVITFIVNESLTSGQFIREWKTAIVRPLLKKVNLELIKKNYRPVSNLCFLSKVVERCMLHQFTDHCNKYQLIPDFQSAYRENYSTETALLRMCNDILMGMESQQVTMVAIMDLSAAFDTVDHNIFLNIMQNRFGITGSALNWFRNYLSPRGFKVCINNKYSSEKDLTFSVPQGSCAGAVLFTAYCSPIEDQIERDCTLNGFADDHSIRKSFKAGNKIQEHDTRSEIQYSLLNVKTWMSQMKLKINGEKTEYIMFGNQIQLAKCDNDPLVFDSDLIQLSKCVKYLGGHLDSNLSFKDHIAKKCKAALINFNRIRSIRKVITREVCVTLVLSLCVSHLDYGNSMLFGLPSSSIKPMQRVQNMCAKIVLKKSKYDSNTECLKELHWLPIKARIEYKILTIMFNTVKGNAPAYLKSLVEARTVTRLTRSSDNHYLLKVPRTKTKTYGPRAFQICGPVLWNGLPNYLRRSESLTIFKKKLKTHLFNQHFTD